MQKSIEEVPSLLVLIIDTNPLYWSTSSFPFKSLLESVLLFINSYLLLHRRNRLVVIASHHNKSKILFPTSSSVDTTGSAEQFGKVDTQIVDELQKLVTETPDVVDKSKSSIASAISRGLCFIHRVLNTIDSIQPRILVVQGTEDASEQYIPIMNGIFSAQKLSIPVDGCIIGKSDSSFLQQASQLTNGIYLKRAFASSGDFFQVLVSLYLLDTQMRSVLELPVQNNVDFRAVCFCHQKTISVAYVCPVCLSLFCSFSPVCSTCGVRSYIKPPKRQQ